MIKTYCIVFDKYRKFKKPEMSYIQKNIRPFLLFALSVVTKTKN